MYRSKLDEIISCASLPTLPTIAVQLLELTSDPNVELNEISRLVESDPGLAAKILRTVNSSLYGLRTPCTSIQRALTYLGLNAVKSLVLGFSLVQMTGDLEEESSFDFTQFWRHSVLGAVASRHIASRVSSCDPDEAFTCGMFQSMGILASYVALGPNYLDLIEESGGDDDALAAAEQERFGFTHFQTGSSLGEKWKFPSKLVSCLRYIPVPDRAPEDAEDMTRVVALGRLAAEILSDHDAGDRLMRIRGLTESWFGEDFDDLNEVLEAITESAKELASVLDKDIGSSPDLEMIRRCAEQQSLELQLAIQHEIEDLRRQKVELTSAAFTDGLTGVWNRKKFDEDLQAAFTNSQDSDRPFAIMFFDADRFKCMNDQFGHQIGDEVLRELSHRLHDTVGSLGAVYRYGGEEFTVILPGWDMGRASKFGELIRTVIESPDFDVSSVDENISSIHVTVSIGVSCYDSSGSDSSGSITNGWDVVRAADDAMYDAKNSGRNCLRTKSASSVAKATTEGSKSPIEKKAGPTQSLVRGEVSIESVKPGDTVNSDGLQVIKILLVEDDALAATLLRAVFAQHKGFEVRRVVDPVDAISCMSAREGDDAHFIPDVILCDHLLRKGTAMDIVQFVRSSDEYCGIGLVVMAANPNEQMRSEYEDAGLGAVQSKEYMATHMSKWIADFKAKWAKGNGGRKKAA